VLYQLLYLPVERIEYCDVMGRLVASADLSDYRDVPKTGMIPRMIELRHFRSARTDLILRLRLSGMSYFTPSAKQTKLFSRPSSKGYGSVYRWTEIVNLSRIQNCRKGNNHA